MTLIFVTATLLLKKSIGKTGKHLSTAVRYCRNGGQTFQLVSTSSIEHGGNSRMWCVTRMIRHTLQYDWYNTHKHNLHIQLQSLVFINRYITFICYHSVIPTSKFNTPVHIVFVKIIHCLLILHNIIYLLPQTSILESDSRVHFKMDQEDFQRASSTSTVGNVVHIVLHGGDGDGVMMVVELS